LSLAGTVADQDGYNQSGSRGVRSGNEDDSEVMIRSSWQQRAPAGKQEQEVTQLAAHSISDGNQSSAVHRGPCEDFCEEGVGAVARSLSQFWQAGDAIGSVRTTAGLPISMAEFTRRRAVAAYLKEFLVNFCSTFRRAQIFDSGNLGHFLSQGDKIWHG